MSNFLQPSSGSTTIYRNVIRTFQIRLFPHDYSGYFRFNGTTKISKPKVSNILFPRSATKRLATDLVEARPHKSQVIHAKVSFPARAIPKSHTHNQQIRSKPTGKSKWSGTCVCKSDGSTNLSGRLRFGRGHGHHWVSHVPRRRVGEAPRDRKSVV